MRLPTPSPNSRVPPVQRGLVVRQRQHQSEPRRLGEEYGRCRRALVEPVRHRAEAEPAAQRREAAAGDRERGAVRAQPRQQEGDLVDDEADLGGDRQGKGRGERPEMPVSQGVRLAADDGQCPLLATGHRDPPGQRRAAPPDRDEDQRDQHRHQRAGDAKHGTGKADARAQRDERRRHREAAGAGAAQREAEGEAALPVEPPGEGGGDRRRARPRPAEPHHQIARIELPGRRHPAHADRTGTQREHTAAQHGARPEPLDRPADPGQHAGAEQEGQGGAAADQRGRPAVRLLQFGKEHRLTVGAEPPGQHRRPETRQDHRPTAAELAWGRIPGGQDDRLWHREPAFRAIMPTS